MGERAVNHLAAIFIDPLVFACTPSAVSVLGLNPVFWSTTVTGDVDVLFVAAQPGIIPFSV